MRRLHLLLIATLLLGAAAPRSQPARPPQQIRALVGGLLVDGFGGPPIQNSVILIDGDKIAAVGQVGLLAVPAGAEVISTEGMTVLPGLWDTSTMIAGHADYDPGQGLHGPVRVGDHAAAAKQRL